MKKRVLFLCPQPFFQWRGSPIRVAFDVRVLSELGWEVDLVVFPVGLPADLPPNVRLHRVPNLFRVRRFPIGPSFWKAVYDVLLFVQAAWLALRRRPSVVHGVEDAGPIAAVVSRLVGARCVFEKHSDPGSYRKRGLRNLVMAVYVRAEAFAIRRADAVIGTGPALVEQARAVSPATPAHHIFDIPSSLTEADPDRVAALRATLARAPGEVLALYVGSFEAYQGIDLLFDAMPHAVRACPGLRFLIIGGTPAQIEQRGAVLRDRGIEASVTFLGKIPPDELPNYLGAADILLSPRIAGRNTPLKLLDYLKAGRAIAATDTEANRLILNDRLARLLPVEPAGFGAGVAALAADPAARDALASAGRSLVDRRYNFGEFKRRLGLCYDALAPDRAPEP